MRNAENDLAVCEKAIKAAMQSGISVMGEEDALLLETARESLPYWINRAQELEERLQIDPQGSDKIDELEQALEFCKYERDEARKEVEQFREALQTIAFPVKHSQQEAEKAGATLDGEMVMALSNDAGWMKDVARKALEEGKEND